jgi:hypothetical protein
VRRNGRGGAWIRIRLSGGRGLLMKVVMRVGANRRLHARAWCVGGAANRATDQGAGARGGRWGLRCRRKRSVKLFMIAFVSDFVF